MMRREVQSERIRGGGGRRGGTYFDVSTCGERGENKEESQTQNHHVESPSVCHGSAQRLILREVILAERLCNDSTGLQI